MLSFIKHPIPICAVCSAILGILIAFALRDNGIVESATFFLVLFAILYLTGRRYPFQTNRYEYFCGVLCATGIGLVAIFTPDNTYIICLLPLLLLPYMDLKYEGTANEYIYRYRHFFYAIAMGVLIMVIAYTTFERIPPFSLRSTVYDYTFTFFLPQYIYVFTIMLPLPAICRLDEFVLTKLYLYFIALAIVTAFVNRYYVEYMIEMTPIWRQR